MSTTMTASNGLRLLVEELPYTRSASIGCYVGVGARHEPPRLSGVAHLIEHMCFKGTRNLPNPKTLSQLIEGVGGMLDAATAYESTVYSCKVADMHVDRALHVLTEMIRYPLFTARDLEKERRVIIEEISGTQDVPSDWVHDVLKASMWGDQPIGRDIAGSAASISAISRDDLVAFWRQYYGQDTIVISVAGNVHTAHIVEAIDAAFHGAEMADPRPAIPTAPPQPGPRLTLHVRDAEQGNFCLGFPSISYNDPDRRALQVLDTALGAGMSSRLFQELREERGIAYDVGSYHSEIADAGMWVIYGGVETESIHEGVAVALNMVRDVLDNGITEEELDLVKEQIKGGMLLALEDSAAIAARNGAHQLRYGRVIPVEQIMAEIEAVAYADVLRAARRVIRSGALHLAVIGPYDAADERRLRTLIEAGF